MKRSIILSFYALVILPALSLPWLAATPVKDRPIITTHPADGGGVYRPGQPIDVFFSAPVKPAEFSFRIEPDPGGWKAIWDSRGRRVALQHANPFKPGRYLLEIRIKKEPEINLNISFTSYGPSGLSLIDTAEKSGALDSDKAMTYRFLALFADPALPAAYQSATPFSAGTTIYKDFFARRDSLKPETLARLRPYLVRPDHPESVYAREELAARPASPWDLLAASTILAAERPPGRYLPVDGDRIRFWAPSAYRQRAEKARSLEAKYRIYAKFLALLGKGPKSDADLPENGGDGRLDIYLVPGKPGMWTGLTVAAEPGQQRACWITINREIPDDDILASVLAHEIFHAFQFAFDATEDDWFLEGTAVWAEDFIGKDWDFEHDYLDSFFQREFNRMETLTGESDGQKYGAYLFPYYLTKCAYKNDSILAEIWRACPNAFGSLKVVKSVMGEEKFAECFKQFALYNSGAGEYARKYPEALDLKNRHGMKSLLLRGSFTDEEMTAEINIPPLAAVYIEVENWADPEETPLVILDLADFAAIENLTVQAVIDPDGRCETQDWTGVEEKRFCLLNEEEKFESIVIVVASKDPKQVTFSRSLRVTLEPDRCDTPRWQGTLTYKRNINYDFTEPTPAGGTYRIERNLAESAVVHLTAVYSNSYRDSDGTYNYYHLQKPTGSYSISCHFLDLVSDSKGWYKREAKVQGGGSLQPEGGGLLAINVTTGEYDLKVDFYVDECRGTEHHTYSSGGGFDTPFVWSFNASGLSLEGKTNGKTVAGHWSKPAGRFFFTEQSGLVTGVTLNWNLTWTGK